MSEYRRLYVPGGTYFFTLVTYKRAKILCSPPAISRLKTAFNYVKNKKSFNVEGLVILPDHLHCILKLPEGDCNYSIRWSMIKRYFSLGFSSCSNIRREKYIWQRRFWEHFIRDEKDFQSCMDYIHYNPVKHGYVKNPIDWKYSTFRANVRRGYYSIDWASEMEPTSLKNLDME